MENHNINLKMLFFFLFASILFLMNSCSSEENFVKSDPNNIVEFAKFTPFNITVNKEKAIVSFVQSQIPFEIDLLNNLHQKDVNLIQEVIGKDIPVRVFVFKGTNRIAKILSVTDVDIAEYRKSLITIDNAILNRPDPLLISIFPDELTLMNMFNLIVSNSCANNNQDGCLTFQLASDGCNARAHKMKQILNQNSYNCQKQFIFGSDLLASTSSCCIQWVYHTAPLVLVKNNNNEIEERVIDPSLFDVPVTPAVWREACQNLACVFNPDFEFQPVTYKTVPGIVFNYDPSSMSFLLDSDYFRTNCTLGVYQNQSGCGIPDPFPPQNCQN